ncbi:LysR family transcriptional regulator [Motiliproteus sp. MSK22-1]|uniref:LysR family transcriptional regulator n=1 Tax=Motiliproteus sp. MSK22-1 TaxID=1897630 RepID=UPI00097741CF|nr:LysR family transcriptional regulator [Motiliproteus sp. MSK22-1]OMH33880.1 transcriptional regulator [Motiliproteus sp. MSK22-1]
MIDDLRAMVVFAKTVESGSFRGAAKELKLTPSVVSHHISRLEERLGVTLLYRSTRRLSLTDDGNKLFRASQKIIEAATEGLDAIAGHSSEPSGNLSLTVPAMLARDQLVQNIAAFADKYPKVNLSISFSDLQQDLIQGGIDLAIRIGGLKDSALKSKRLFVMKRKLVASPSLLKRNSQPKHPEDLKSWDWIGLKMRPNHKILVNQSGDHYQIDYQPRIIVDSLEAVCQLAIAGTGLASPPAFMVKDALESGQLIEPIKNWDIESLGVYAVWPPNATRESLTYRLISFLAEQQERRV